MFLIRLKRYFVWFLVNFVICLLPLFVSLLANQATNQLFLGFLSFSFTLIISSLYLFETVIYMREDKTLSDLLKWGSFLWVFILFIVFIFYPEIPAISLRLFFQENIISIVELVIVVTIIFTFLLNRPSIELLVIKLSNEKKMKESKKLREDVEKMKDRLNKELKK